MPITKPKSQLATQPLADLRRQLSEQSLKDTQQEMGPLRKNHFGPRDIVDPLKIEAVSPTQKFQERQLPASDEPLAKDLFRAVTGDNDAFYSNPFADPNAIADVGGMAGAMEKVGKKAVAKALPDISPEAYDHVKAGGLRLYSRLTDAIAKHPQPFNANTIRKIAKAGASAEEIELRQLEKFLNGRTHEMVPREEIMGHLGANPINLNIVRKGGKKLAIPPEPTPELSAGALDLQKATAAVNDHGTRMDQFTHQLETTYGGDWRDELDQNTREYQEWLDLTDEGYILDEALEAAEMRAGAGSGGQVSEYVSGQEPEMDYMHTDGPYRNYGETLVNLPSKAIPREQLVEEWYQSALKGEQGVFDPNPGSTPELDQVIDIMRGNPGEYKDVLKDFAKEKGYADFTQSHFDNDPNNLVWSTSSERELPISEEQRLDTEFQLADAYRDTQEIKRTPYNPNQPDDPTNFLPVQAARKQYQQLLDTLSPTRWGKFIEELQSDWHQKGAKRGYRTPEANAAWAESNKKSEDLNLQMGSMHDELVEAMAPIQDTNYQETKWDWEGLSQGYGNLKEMLDDYEATPQKFHGLLSPEQHATIQKYLDVRAQERELFDWRQDNHIDRTVPDAPYKDTYPELQMKVDLLDTANDPDLEWFGIADADTASYTENHTDNLGDPDLKPGMELFYGKKYPNALQKLLKPFGGKVEHDMLPGIKTNKFASVQIPGTKIDNGGRFDGQYAPKISKGGETLAHIIPIEGKGAFSNQDRDIWNIAEQVSERYPDGSVQPGSGFWRANMPPKMKRDIAKRGFSAMALLAALQKANTFSGEEQ